ncbi:MAG: sugar phosphate isomerase/epimerase family protein [Planctomycetota bacterium]
MVRISMSELTTYRWSFEKDVRQYVQAGFDGIAVWRRKLSDFGDEKGAELIADTGLAVSSLLWAGGFTGSEGQSFKESVEDAHAAIRLGGLLQANCLVVHSGSRAGHTLNHARRLLVNALKELLPHAEEMGVGLVLQPMHRDCASEWTFLTSIDETLAVLEKVDHPQLKVSFNSYCFGCDGATVAALPGLTPYLGLVQLSDARHGPDGEQERCPLGEGIIPLDTIVMALTEAGYKGFFEVELMGQEIETADYTELLRASRQVASRLIGTEV